MFSEKSSRTNKHKFVYFSTRYLCILLNNLRFSFPNFNEIKLRVVNIIYSPIPLCLLAIRNYALKTIYIAVNTVYPYFFRVSKILRNWNLINNL